MHDGREDHENPPCILVHGPIQAGDKLPKGPRPPRWRRRAHPLAARGEGLNLGMGDAMNLGWKLAATLRRESEPPHPCLRVRAFWCREFMPQL